MNPMSGVLRLFEAPAEFAFKAIIDRVSFQGLQRIFLQEPGW